MFRLLLLLLSFSSIANASSFMPDNELWREDCLGCLNASGISETQFNAIVEGGRKAYASLAKANKEKLVINAKWTDSTVNANCMRSFGTVTVNMFGGLARRKEITIEGFSLVLGHELSHAYGGTPYYPNTNKMSAEGQADYISTKQAYALIAQYVPELQATIDADTFIKSTCNQKYGRFADNRYTYCIKELEGGKSLGSLLAVLNNEPIPDYETPDETIVTKTETSYPATTQCRLDSYFAGALNKSRPKCWFYK